MAKLIEVKTSDGAHWGYRFDCPGCGRSHRIPDDTPRGWTFNGDLQRPTFTPSILVHPHDFTQRDGSVGHQARCHSFVTDGAIAFLGDSEHALAGKTVDLLDV